MKRAMLAVLAAIAGVVLQGAAAGPDEKPVPIQQAPYHRPVFSNQYITLLDVYIPPGRNTGYHIHSQDQVSVNISVAQQTNQNYGSAVVNPPGAGAERGRATFTGYVKEGTRTHKATNIGKTPFHNISFLLTAPRPYGTTASTREALGYVQIMDNERVRGWRIVLDPGQSTSQITQTAPGLRVVVQPGEIAEVVPNRADRAMWLGEGQYFWQDPGTTRAVKNIGTTRVEFVEFELK